MNRAVSHHFLSANLFFQTILLFFITFTNSFSIQIIFLLILSIFYTVFMFSALFVYYTQFQRSIFIYIAQYVFTVFLLYPFLFSTFFEQNTKKSTAIFFHNVYFLSKKDDGNQSVRFSRTLNSNYKKEVFQNDSHTITEKLLFHIFIPSTIFSYTQYPSAPSLDPVPL